MLISTIALNMHLPSFSFIISGIFISYICYSIYTVSLLFTLPPCDEGCVKSYLRDQPKLNLHLFTSITKYPLKNEITQIYMDADFDYIHEKEM